MAHKDTNEPPATERSLRNPRRRNRVESESIKTAPRRKRSKITETTFVPRDSPDESVEDDVQTNGHAAPNIPRSYSRQPSVSIASGDIDIPIRGARNSIKRTVRADGARTLTQNDHYSVKLLPSAPKELLGQGVNFRGSISVSANLALAVTKEQVYIWDYSGHTSASSVKSIELPFHCTQHDPLPFGAFVTNSGGNDLGLILVSAVSGKIVYHESIERVTSLGFFQERRGGIEGTIAGLFSTEKCVQLVSADSAGYIALLSSGRTVHISLRDAQGKPKITTQILYTNEQSAGGFFGSIKNILGSGAWKQAVSAVRIRPLERGQVQVLGLAERGELRIWDLDWSGRYAFRASIDFRDQLQHELCQMRPVERHGDVDHLALLDLTVLEKSQHVSATSGKPMDAILLVRCGAAGMHTYSLVEFTLAGNDFTLARILDVNVESQTVTQSHQSHIVVPAPGHTAFVVLPDTVAVLSLATAASNPEAQLHDASYIEATPFQDAIHLRPNRGLGFTGGDQDLSKTITDASSVVFVDGAGLVRIIAHESQAEIEISVKSRIEQAVFYGYEDNNLLDLLRAGPKIPNVEAVEEAVVSISDGILQSSSRYFDFPPTSVSSNLQKRAEAAANLAAYIQRSHHTISHPVSRQLRTDAEKIAAGGKLWELFETHLANATKGKRRSTLLNEVCEIIKSRYPFDSLWTQNKSDDIVRTFFTTQLFHIGKLLPWTRRILEDIRQDHGRDSADILRLVSEADDIWLCCLHTAWEFREDHAKHYDLSTNEILDHECRKEIPEPWTASDDILKDVDKMIDLARTAVQAVFENDLAGSPEGDVKKIATENPALVDAMCQVYLERITWYESRGSAIPNLRAAKLRSALEIKRHDEIRQLAEVGQVEASITLAEKYLDMKTLTEVVIAESQYLKESMESAGQQELAAIQAQVDAIFNKVADYFDRFGDAFADAFFGEGFAGGKGGKMLTDAHERWQAPMTRWLQQSQARAKICWINDVLKAEDYKHATYSLWTAATKSEDNIWNKKVELSLAKLSINAFFQDDATEDHEDATFPNDHIDGEMDMIDVQNRLYQHVMPETYHFLDAESAVQAAMEAFFNPLLAFSTWHRVMYERMAKLLAHQSLNLDELIDLITLAESKKTIIKDQDNGRSETFEALDAISAIQDLKPGRLDTLTKLSWKRLYLKEDWQSLNARVGSESEHDMQETLVQTDIYRAFYLVLSAKMAIPDCRMTVLEPSDTLDAGCHVDDVSAYVPHELRDSVLEENIIMERQLEAMIREQNIQSWVRDAIELAEKHIAEQRNNDTDSSLEPDGHEGQNGHVPNGHGDGIKTEDEEDSSDLAAIAQAPVQDTE